MSTERTPSTPWITAYRSLRLTDSARPTGRTRGRRATAARAAATTVFGVAVGVCPDGPTGRGQGTRMKLAIRSRTLVSRTRPGSSRWAAVPRAPKDRALLGRDRQEDRPGRGHPRSSGHRPSRPRGSPGTWSSKSHIETMRPKVRTVRGAFSRASAISSGPRRPSPGRGSSPTEGPAGDRVRSSARLRRPFLRGPSRPISRRMLPWPVGTRRRSCRHRTGGSPSRRPGPRDEHPFRRAPAVERRHLMPADAWAAT